MTAHNVKVDYIIVSEERSPHLLKDVVKINGKVNDEYFNISFLIQKDEEYNEIINEKIIFTIRDLDQSDKINFNEINQFNKPTIYRND